MSTVSILNLLTGSSTPLLASGDVVPFVDIDDTTQSASGSTVKATMTQFFAAIPVPIIVTNTGTQFQLKYDGSNHVTVAVSSAGAVTLNATGASAGFTFSDAVTVTGVLTATAAAEPVVVNNSTGTAGNYRSLVKFQRNSSTKAYLALDSADALCVLSDPSGTVAAVTFTPLTGAATFVAGITATTGTFGTSAAGAGEIRLPYAGSGLNFRNSTNGGDIGGINCTGSNDINIGAGAGSISMAVRVLLAGAATAGSGTDVYLGGTTQTTIGANGAASALTANPLGYLIAYKGATKIVIPYYNG